MPRPPGELLCRVATVNDLHFGEVEAGRIDERTDGPIQRVTRDEDPYPETMNNAAVAEIAAVAPAAVVVKGDLSTDGTDEEFAAFEACYRAEFGERLHVVRGNHDSYRGQTSYAGDSWIDLPGVSIALLDTAIPGGATGSYAGTARLAGRQGVRSPTARYLSWGTTSSGSPVRRRSTRQAIRGRAPECQLLRHPPDPSDTLD